jgi:dTDP-4-amino-4,6-dideoxygalactose transaminase
MFRSHGITKENFINKNHGEWYYEMQFLGYNYRMTDIQAALGISQLKKLNKFIEKRRTIVKSYDKAFKNNPYFDIPVEKDYAYSSYHLYPIRLKDKYKNKRKNIFSEMRKSGLGVQVHYIPVYLQPYYQNMGFKKEICPVGEDFYQREISIPLYFSIGKEEIAYVIKTIFQILGEYR